MAKLLASDAGADPLKERNAQWKETSRAVFFMLVLCILGAAIVFTLALVSPPLPLPADAPSTDFSAGRAMQDLEVIAREPHPKDRPTFIPRVVDPAGAWDDEVTRRALPG